MPKKVKNDGQRTYSKDEMWIAPHHSLKTRPSKIGWEVLPGQPSSNRFLELADIALGVKKPPTSKKDSLRKRA